MRCMLAAVVLLFVFACTSGGGSGADFQLCLFLRNISLEVFIK